MNNAHKDLEDSISTEFIDRLQRFGEQIGQATQRKAREHLLDTLTVALAGATELQMQHQKIIEQLNADSGAIPIFGLNRGSNLLIAALLNATSAHKLELDDGSRYGMVHPGACIIPALIALAASEPICGEMLLRGIVVGYEATIRLAMALQPGLRERGFHATGPCGAIGVAMAAAEALQLCKGQRETALAAAATQAAGLVEVIRDGSDMKPFNAGQAALNGLLAVVIARSGSIPPRDVLGGPQGLLQALSPVSNRDKLLSIDTEQPAINTVYVKPYGSCRHCHGPIELALGLRRMHKITANQIQRVLIRTYAQGIKLHDHSQVQNSNDARMSTPYSVAVALCTGDASMAGFSEKTMNAPDVQQVMSLVVMEEDPQRTALVPKQRGSELTLLLKDGRQLKASLDLPLGEPERPINGIELEAKAYSMLKQAGWSRQSSNELVDAVDQIHENIDLLLTCLQR